MMINNNNNDNQLKRLSIKEKHVFFSRNVSRLNLSFSRGSDLILCANFLY